MREAPNIPNRAGARVAPTDPSGRSADIFALRNKRGGRLTDRIMTEGTRPKAPTFWERVIWPTLDRLTAQGSAVWRVVNEDDLRVRLMRAGFPYGMRAQTFLVVKLLAIPIFMLLMAFYEAIVNDNIMELPSWVIWPALGFGALIGFRLPDIWLGGRVKARQKEIQLILPDTIDLIAISVEAGLGLIAAIQRISERFPNALSEEFLRTLQEVRLGRTQADALRDMARRVDVEDLSALLTAMVQAEQLGLAISNVLTVQSERLRERRAQRAREAAQKAPIKMTFPLVLFIFPALFIVILGPALIRIFTQNALG